MWMSYNKKVSAINKGDKNVSKSTTQPVVYSYSKSNSNQYDNMKVSDVINKKNFNVILNIK
jgi:hypothetical protein